MRLFLHLSRNFPRAEVTEQTLDVAYCNGKYVQVVTNGLIHTSINALLATGQV
ncbi:hypothetical protein [Dyadobacter bucti]|uniref:hypothetical protein n=1 Tax=Dyadobacter bucti TaxID=2572203 RepID=UPI003F715CD4